MKLHIVSVNFNSASVLRKAIASLASDSYHLWTIVDSASTNPDERELLTDLATDSVQIHLSTENRGFGSGVNLAVRLADPAPGDVIWILNPDTIVNDAAASAIERHLAEYPATIISPRILSERRDTESPWFAGGAVDRRLFRVRHNIEAKTGDLPFVPGTAIATTMETWHLLGGFREDLFMYWEDVDLCFRAAELGIPVMVLDDAVIVHAEGASSKTSDRRESRSATYYYWTARNRVVVSKDWASRKRRLSAPFWFMTFAMIFTPLRREPSGRIRKSIKVLSGISAGLRHPMRASGRRDARPAVDTDDDRPSNLSRRPLD